MRLERLDSCFPADAVADAEPGRPCWRRLADEVADEPPIAPEVAPVTSETLGDICCHARA